MYIFIYKSHLTMEKSATYSPENTVILSYCSQNHKSFFLGQNGNAFSRCVVWRLFRLVYWNIWGKILLCSDISVCSFLYGKQHKKEEGFLVFSAFWWPHTFPIHVHLWHTLLRDEMKNMFNEPNSFVQNLIKCTAASASCKLAQAQG